MRERSRVRDPKARRPEFLTFGKPEIGEAEIAEVVQSLRSGWVGTGPKVARFERGLSEYVRTPHVSCLSSCSAALYLGLKLSGIQASDEVIMPSMTFVATANAVEHVGATPILVDVEPHTGLLDFQAAEAAITPRTRAVVPVHMAGRPVDQGALTAFAARHEVTVIEDAAHAIGAEWRGRRVGAHGHFTAFSFHANKNVSTGEGGALVCPDEALAARAGRLARQGVPSDAWTAFTERG